MRRLALASVALAAVASGFLVYSLARGGSSASAAVSRAAGRLLDTRSSRVRITLTFGTHSFVATGLLDYRSHRGELDYGDIQTVTFDGDTSFWRFAHPIAGAKPWVRISNAGEPDGFDPQERALEDPSKFLPFLREGSGDVRKVGREVVGGVEATHYQGTLELQRMVDRATGTRRAELQELLDALKDFQAPTTIPYGIWVDDASRLVRLRYSEGSDAQGSVTVEFFDYGVPVVLNTPPADQVMSSDDYFELVMKEAKDSPGCKTDSTSTPEGDGGLTLCMRVGDLTAEGTR